MENLVVSRGPASVILFLSPLSCQNTVVFGLWSAVPKAGVCSKGGALLGTGARWELPDLPGAGSGLGSLP